MPLLCSFPAVQLRLREVMMVQHNVPRRTMTHFAGLFLLTTRRSTSWSRGRRERPHARRQRLSSSITTIIAQFRPMGDAHSEFSAGYELIRVTH